jgi:epoxyqueuosine reductase
VNSLQKYSYLIKQEAKRLGFETCGIAKAGFLEKEANNLEQWLKNGYHGNMQYMENYFDKRLDPRLLVEDAKSVISLSFNYYPNQTQNKDSYKLAKYAYGEDYHYVLKSKLKELIFFIQNEIGEVNGRVFVDSAPVLERAWAQKSGIGLARQTFLIYSKKQRLFFLFSRINFGFRIRI